VRRGSVAAAIALLLVAIALASVVVRRCAQRRTSHFASSVVGSDRWADDSALARLQEIPLYRTLIHAKAMRAGTVDGDGTLHVEVDLRAVIEPRLAALGIADTSGLFPVSARGTISIQSSVGLTATVGLRESWIFDGPATVFDLFDRNPAGRIETLALDAIPGAPSALVRMRLMPSRLADPSFGGAAFAPWRDRASFAEKLLGRPLRAEIAEDLAGPAVFALYETEADTEAEAVLAVELRRSDRLAGLLDMLFGLGALTERATVRRYRGVATGSFVSGSGGPGLALAVDGPVLFVATSRARLESAIDARRTGPQRGGIAAAEGDSAASWNAVSASAFVAHGWARLTRSADEAKLRGVKTSAALWPEGVSRWRLEVHGPAPAITADPILPFLRSVFGRRQRDGD